MGPRHRHEQRLAREAEIPRRPKRDRARLPLPVERLAAELPRPGDDVDALLRQVRAEDDVGARIRHVELGGASPRHSLRIVERRLVERPGAETRHPRADRMDDVTPAVDHEHAMMPAVGNRDAPVGPPRDLAGVRERPGRDRRRSVHGEGRLRQRARAAGARELVLDEPGEGVEVGLAGCDGGDRPVGAHDDERRPGAHGVRGPGAHVAVDEDGVLDAVARDGLPDVRRVLLGVELGGVDAEDDQRLLRETLLDAPQHGDDVHAVDAAVGPEVEEDDLTAQLSHGEPAVGVQPLELGIRSPAHVRRVPPSGAGD